MLSGCATVGDIRGRDGKGPESIVFLDRKKTKRPAEQRLRARGPRDQTRVVQPTHSAVHDPCGGHESRGPREQGNTTRENQETKTGEVGIYQNPLRKVPHKKIIPHHRLQSLPLLSPSQPCGAGAISECRVWGGVAKRQCLDTNVCTTVCHESTTHHDRSLVSLARARCACLRASMRSTRFPLPVQILLPSMVPVMAVARALKTAGPKKTSQSQSQPLLQRKWHFFPPHVLPGVECLRWLLASDTWTRCTSVGKDAHSLRSVLVFGATAAA